MTCFRASSNVALEQSWINYIKSVQLQLLFAKNSTL